MRRLLLVIAVSACSGGDPGDPGGDAPGGAGEPAALAGITLYHNQVRAMVDTTGLSAGPLPPLAWDPALAATAAAWVAQCKDADGDGLVDHNAGRSIGQPFYVGENIFASSGTATAHDAVLLPVYGWAAEQAHYHYDTNTCDAGATCGHYTQVVWRATGTLGCALGSCPGLGYPSTIVCDYGPGGNVGSQKPY
ncbi:MAG TPA: CAP domain-containing protein [Kofleriaceae bacterium]|nr:CAP domain-containing protein [Kofleriaceae bacterium]